MTNPVARVGMLVPVVAMLVQFRPAVAAQISAVDSSLDAVLASARSYLARYQTDLTFIIADEDTTQRVVRQNPAVRDAPKRRTTQSEVHFKFIEGDGAWMAIRNVASVDGVAVEDRPDLRAALLNQNAGQVARSFKSFNSQFNIGRLFRNFNEPTLALGVLDPKRAAAMEFSRKGARVRDGATLVTLGFRERRSAEAFVYDLLMRPAPVDGEIVVEAGTGRIRSTVLKVSVGSVKAELSTVYGHDLKTDLWVPVNFMEYYEDGTDQPAAFRLLRGMLHEVIRCESTYTNFRRFTATARIK